MDVGWSLLGVLRVFGLGSGTIRDVSVHRLWAFVVFLMVHDL